MKRTDKIKEPLKGYLNPSFKGFFYGKLLHINDVLLINRNFSFYYVCKVKVRLK